MSRNSIILALSLPLGFLVVVVSLVGLYSPAFYATEALNWQAQTTGQDMIDLFMVAPCMLTSAYLAYKGNKIATTVWGGSVCYLAYTFALYCFDIHFNRLFIAYCLCLGLSIYSVIYFVVISYKQQLFFHLTHKAVSRYISIYFLLVALLFYVLWLSEIIPANLQNLTPPSLRETGLFTNGVQVLDLSILLPAMVIVGIFLWKRSVIGFILAPILLVFFILMNITIGFLQYIMVKRDVANGMGIVLVMLSLALISLFLLILFFRNSKVATSK